MNWDAITSVATVISMVAFILTALYVRAELRAAEKDRYLSVTNQLFAIWETKDFMDAQLWLLHRLEETTWHEFIEAHRADFGEAAFHRVGAFYDRVGTLVRLGLVNEKEILSTVGAHAIAVWQKIRPLVDEARRIENSVLFHDFERLLPACHECYMPALGKDPRATPFSLIQPGDSAAPPSERIGRTALKRRLVRGEPLTLVDVRPAAQVADEPRTLPKAVLMPIDEVERRHAELPVDRELVFYCA